MRYLSVLILTFWASLSSAQETITHEQNIYADKVIWGGPIYTADDRSPKVEALAIVGDTILHAGSRSQAESMINATTQIIDLNGATAFPGFTDGHAHLSGIGERALSLNLDTATSLQSFTDMLIAWWAEHPEDTVIMGSGWIETHWSEKRFPTRWDIDRVIKDIPVILFRADYHALVANSKALELASISAKTQAPFGGEILQNALGEITGILVDNAQSLVTHLQPKTTPEDIKKHLATGAQIYAEQGWTGLHNMGVPYSNVEMIEALSDNGDIPIRVYNSLTREDGETLFQKGPRKNSNGKVVTNAIKLFMDGALGSRGAALLEPYSDADTDGLMMTTKEETLPLLIKALENGVQINTHAIGDRANRLLLDWYEEALSTVPPLARPIPEPRWRIEHAQIVNPNDIPRFATLGIIPSMQPSHAIGDLHFAPSRLGDTRLNGAYSWTSLIKSGVIIAGGSDAPVEQGNLFVEFYAATARHDLKGFQGPNWHPEEAVTRENALKMFTLWPAIASFQEDKIGSLIVGKKADISVFNIDLMTVAEEDIPKGKTVMTIIAGDIVYSAPILTE